MSRAALPGLRRHRAARRPVRRSRALVLALAGTLAALVFATGIGAGAGSGAAGMPGGVGPIGGVSAAHAESQTVDAEPEATAESAEATGESADTTTDSAAGITEAGTESVSEPAPELAIAPLDAVLDDDAGEYRFTISLRNESEQSVPAGSLRVLLDPRPLDSAAELVAGARDESSASVRIAQVSFAATPAGEERNLTVTVPRADLPLALTDASGVYLVQAELRLTPSEPLDAWVDPLLVSTPAPIVWQGFGEIGQVPVTLVIPLVLPESVRVMPTRAQLEQVVPRLARLVDAAETHQATLAVDPRIVAGIRALGDDAPASAVAFLEQLETTSAQLFALQFADADPAAQSALGLTELLAPTGLTFATSQGSFGSSAGAPDTSASGGTGGTGGNGDGTAGDATDTDTNTDTETNPDTNADTNTDASTTPGDTAADAADPNGGPSLSELLALPQTVSAAWPAAGAVDTAALALLTAAGIDSVVLDSSNAAEATAARVRIDDFTALIADTDLTAASRAALDEASVTDQASGVAALTVRFALAAQQGSGGIVFAVDRGAIAEAADPARLIDSLVALDWVTAVPDSAQPEGTATLRAGETAEERRELLRGTVSRSAQIDELAPLLEQPAYLTEYQRVRLLEAFATRYAEPGVDFAAVDEATRARDTELLRGVEIVPTENTQLVGTSSRVPITLHNLLPFDAAVSVRVTPLSAAIAVPERRFDDFRVPAGSNQAVLVTVDSRVSSGESGLHIEVSDSAGETVFTQRSMHLTLRSSYETILLVTLGATAALLLGFGIWRSLRSRARGARSPRE